MGQGCQHDAAKFRENSFFFVNVVGRLNDVGVCLHIAKVLVRICSSQLNNSTKVQLLPDPAKAAVSHIFISTMAHMTENVALYVSANHRYGTFCTYQRL